jgi:hypothetical protein
MEINNERVLAYTLASSLPLEDLEDVSGGGGARTAGGTVQVTGNSATGLDVQVDGTF